MELGLVTIFDMISSESRLWRGTPLHCFVKCAQGEESKGVAGEFWTTVCEKCAQAFGKKELS